MAKLRLVFLFLLVGALAAPKLVLGQAGGLEFLTVVGDEAVPDEVLAEYRIGPHILRYQVVKIDSQMLREFLTRDSEQHDRSKALPMRFTLFDEKPIEFFGELSEIYYEGELTGFAGWVGLSTSDVPFTAKVIVGRDDRVTMEIGSEAGHFEVSVTDFPPFHILWQWNPDFQLGH